MKHVYVATATDINVFTQTCTHPYSYTSKHARNGDYYTIRH